MSIKLNYRYFFEKMPILQALTETDYTNKITTGHIQLNLFES